MRTTISILLCKFVSWLCKITKGIFKKEGSVLPGKCVLKIHKKVLSKIVYPKYVVVVTGSSGKGSTVSLLAHILENNGKRVVWNKNGSNVLTAVVTLVLNNTGAFSHKMCADVLLLEMDERYIEDTFEPGTITHLAITNVTRDQPARNIHPTFIYDKILSSVDEEMHLILNVDDPLLNKTKYTFPGKITTYGIAKSKCDEKGIPNYAIDFAYCPSCKTKLVYDSYHYGHLGVYSCPRCSYSRGKVNYEAKDVDLKKGDFVVNGDSLKLNKNVFFAVYYTLLAYTIADLLQIPRKCIIREINEHQMSSKRGKSYSLAGRNVEMLESKNENSLSYMQSLHYIKDQKGKKTVVMGFENVSRRYKYNDLSWLYDIDFSSLADNSVDKVFLIGRFRYDVATKLSVDGITDDKMILVDDLKDLLDLLKSKSKGSIYTMVCFDMTGVITNMLKEVANEKSN